MPPEGRATLEDPYRAKISLRNDVKCEIGFTKPTYEVRGDVDTLLVPLVRTGPKGRALSVEYKTKGNACVSVCKTIINKCASFTDIRSSNRLF